MHACPSPAAKRQSPRTPVVLVTGLDVALPVAVMDADEVDTRLKKPVIKCPG